MSGRYRFEIDEYNEPYMHIAISGIPIDMDWENTTLFTHAKDVHIDHVYVVPEVEEIDEHTGAAIGKFIFRQILPDFTDLMNGLILHDFPHIHMPEPSVHDYGVYNRSGLVVPTRELIVEDKDETEAMAHFDEEWKYYDGEL